MTFDVKPLADVNFGQDVGNGDAIQTVKIIFRLKRNKGGRDLLHNGKYHCTADLLFG